jgi:esterase/lipase superfamily enzyme
MRLILILALSLSLAACAERGFSPLRPDAERVGTAHEIFVATHRAPDAEGWYSADRASSLSYTKLSVIVPPAHVPGQISNGLTNPDPQTDFTIATKQDFTAPAPFHGAIAARLAALPRDQREVLVYVHGYNNSFFDGVFRTAQMKHDYDLPGVTLHYSWPSAANPLGYTYDRDSVLFARDGLEKVLRDLGSAGANRIVLVGHSLGTMLVMESLRQIEIRTPGWSKSALNGVVLVSPDLDVDLFKAQASRFQSLPEPFAIFVSSRDRALMLSSRINGAVERLGSLTDPGRLSEYPVTIIDVSSFSDGDGARHFTLGSSPLLIGLLSQSDDLNTAFQRDTAGRSGLLSGTVLTVRNATQLILSPGLVTQN